MSNSTTSSTDTVSPGTSGDSWLTTDRMALDAIDQRIIELIKRRRFVSDITRQDKINAGLPRVDLAREKEIISKYTLEFGHYGGILAGSILGISKES